MIRCFVDVGMQYTVKSKNDPLRTEWYKHGYDSAFAAAGVIGARPEFCISDPKRVIVDGLECTGNDGWMLCVGCSNMVYAPTTKVSKKKFRCRDCRT